MRETYLYPYSAEEACRRGEQSLWRASYLENIDCKDAIQKAVRQHYDGAHLDKECLTGVLQEFGYKRTAWVLANTVQQLEWGGQYSSENKAWASQIYIPPDKLHNLSFVVPTRSAVLDGVVDQYRTAYQALGLFGPDQCEPSSFEELDYEGKVLVLSPDTLKESYRYTCLAIQKGGVTMAEEKRNLCAQIPISLHSRVRQEQEASGQTLSEYMTQLIIEFYQMKEGYQNMNLNTKTIAFQVPVELFEEFKAYLQRNNFKQKEFFLGCIQSALAEERDADEASGSEPEPQETDQTE